MRYSTGYLRKQRGKWIGAWYADGKRISKTIGLVKDLTKGDAKEKLAELIKESRQNTETGVFGPFVKGPYFTFYSRKWKHSTRDKNIHRVNSQLVAEFGGRELASLKRDELQDFLDRKAAKYSLSLVSKLRWDLNQICTMAVAEGMLKLNPAALLFAPKEAKRPTRAVMTATQVRTVLNALAARERLIVKLCVLAGMRPGEVLALTWGDVSECSLWIRQRVYEGVLDTPKSNRGLRQVALASGLSADLVVWKRMAVDTGEAAYVFPSEAGTPLGKNNLWRRYMLPKLKAEGLAWANFQVMRRTFSTSSKAAGGDPKVAADQMGHDIGVSVNVYTLSTVASKLELVNRLEQSLIE